jgi:hydrogenase-1 operon protein HyaF
MNPIDLTVVTGPGTQPGEEDGAQLDFMPMPSAMETFTLPMLPEVEQTLALEAARKLLAQVQQGLAGFHRHQTPLEWDLLTLDAENLQLVDQVLGEGEVSIRVDGDVEILIQESVLAGLWRVKWLDRKGVVQRDRIEVAGVPTVVLGASEHSGSRELVVDDEVPPGVLNARSVMVELADQVGAYVPGDEPHVVNLTLLPQSPEDLAYLEQRLGQGGITILSRGYGNCRICSTGTSNLWWVQYFNSEDTMILNTIEVVDVPVAACASLEDIGDSAERLTEILEVYL